MILRLRKEEKKSLISHIILEKKNNYHDNDKVGVNQILLGDNLLYEEDIFIIKDNKKKNNNIFAKIRKWFND